MKPLAEVPEPTAIGLIVADNGRFGDNKTDRAARAARFPTLIMNNDVSYHQYYRTIEHRTWSSPRAWTKCQTFLAIFLAVSYRYQTWALGHLAQGYLQ